MDVPRAVPRPWLLVLSGRLPLFASETLAAHCSDELSHHHRRDPSKASAHRSIRPMLSEASHQPQLGARAVHQDAGRQIDKHPCQASRQGIWHLQLLTRAHQAGPPGTPSNRPTPRAPNPSSCWLHMSGTSVNVAPLLPEKLRQSRSMPSCPVKARAALESRLQSLHRERGRNKKGVLPLRSTPAGSRFLTRVAILRDSLRPRPRFKTAPDAESTSGTDKFLNYQQVAAKIEGGQNMHNGTSAARRHLGKDRKTMLAPT